MKPLVKVAFASGTDDLNRELVDRVAELYPELPLYVVSEFPPHKGRWIRYHVNRGSAENWARCRAQLAGLQVRISAALLVPNVPYRRMRLMALLLSPRGFLAFNESLGSFMLRPRCVPIILRHLLWRGGNLVRWQLRPGGFIYTCFWRLRRPAEWRVPFDYWSARLAGALAGRLHGRARRAASLRSEPLPAGVSVVIPSRNGRDLLTQLLPGLVAERPSEIIVVDNGSDDSTVDWLASEYPQVTVELSSVALSFAEAVNRGIARARFSHTLLINNDMVVEPGFIPALIRPFDMIPDLFCSTAQILFPPGVRREETGKAVWRQPTREDFPVRCDDPFAGEDHSYVLYGSGGCSLYDTRRLRALGSFDTCYAPAYVEDLDVGYRGWQRGWPTVFVAGARVEHRHRATTSRYYTEAELSAVLEKNYLRFLAGAIYSGPLFRRLWREAVERLHLLTRRGEAGPAAALTFARTAVAAGRRQPEPVEPEEAILALCDGSVAVFPGHPARDKMVVLVASPYVPYPLSHGAAVRIYNLMRNTVSEVDLVLVAFTDELQPPAPELLEICTEIVLVRRRGTHELPATDRPDTVEEFDSEAFRGAIRQTVRKWRPTVAQLEFTQMAQYADACAPAKTILVEHDITFDLYQQMLARTGDWETQRQLQRWERFERAAWEQVDSVVVMSPKDRKTVGDRAVTLPNGVDTDRFQPSAVETEFGRALFIGSFAHFPNLLGLNWFVRKVLPLTDAHLHVIAGMNPQRYLDAFEGAPDLSSPRIEMESFVADVRPAYERASMVVVPLLASAGTNVKVLEAMAMGKAIVSTPAGVNGLDLTPGREFFLAETPAEFANAVIQLMHNAALRRELGEAARKAAVDRFEWRSIAHRNLELYRRLARQ